MCEGFDLAAMGLAGPSMIHGLGLSRSTFGLAVSLMMAGFALSATIGGVLGDRVGRRRVVIAGLWTIAVFSALTIGVRQIDGLLAVRFLTGAGIGLVYPNLMAIAADISTAGNRSRIISLVNCGGSVGGLIGAALLAVMGTRLHWQYMFVGGALSALAVLPIAYRVLPRSTNMEKTPARQATPLQVLLGGGRHGTTIALWIACFCTSFIFYMLSGWAPTLLSDRGLSPGQVGAATSALSAAAIVGVLILATLLDLRRYRLSFLLAYAGMIAAFVTFALSGGVAGAFASMAMVGLTVMGGLLLLFALTPALYPEHGKSTGLGAAVATGRIGAILSPWVLGRLLDSGLGQRELFLGLLIPVVIAGLAAQAVAARANAAETR